METTRRDFLRVFGAMAAATAAGAAPRDALAAPATEQAFWKSVENRFILDPKLLYMNIGTTGSTPRPVLDQHDRDYRYVARYPREDVGGGTGGMRARVAPGLGCNVDELVLTTNTTDGMCMSLNGLDFTSNDEIITTIHEHGGGLSPMRLVRDRKGVTLRMVEVPVGQNQSVGDYLDRFADAIAASRAAGRNPTVMVFSHITYLSGTKLPAKELCQLAQSEGLITVIDGAHCPGMLALDFHDMGVDFYAGSGHKWQCGPGGTGLWYVRNQTTSNPLPLPPFWGTLTGSHNSPANNLNRPASFNIGSYLQSHGHPNYPEWNALAGVCEFWDSIGRARIEEYVTGLATALKGRIRDYWGDSALFSPDVPELRCALTGFNPFQDKTNNAKIGEFVTRLREEYGIHIRSTSFTLTNGGPATTRALRVSTHLFHNMGDVDRLMTSMVDLFAKMGPQ
jgi:selenocysteine lyase/cysteine desulfurase